MSKFKVGDKVRYCSGNIGVIGCICNGMYGMSSCISSVGITFTYPSGNTCKTHNNFMSWSQNNEDIELVEEGCRSCEVNSDNIGEILSSAINKLKDNEPTQSSGNKLGKIMSKISSFVKNSLLSADEKLLRKYSLKDDCGDYTCEAKDLVIQKLIKDNEAYLIEVATGLEVEEKKNK